MKSRHSYFTLYCTKAQTVFYSSFSYRDNLLKLDPKTNVPVLTLHSPFTIFVS